MTGLEGNNEFGFPENVNVPRGDSQGNVEEKQNSLLPAGPVIRCFVIPLHLKMKKTNCETRPDHVRFGSCCFPRE